MGCEANAYVDACTGYGVYISFVFSVCQMSDCLRKCFSDVVWVLPDHVGASVCLGKNMCLSGSLQQYSMGSDAAFDDAEKCKSHVEKQIKLRYFDMVASDMPVLSSLH
jgi:hypothetical protein